MSRKDNIFLTFADIINVFLTMEKLLHYVWIHKIFPLEPLSTTLGESVEVIDAGLANTDAGPDFFNAKLKLGGTLWVGNVEIHQRASDWMRHGHQSDKAYDSVILHVVGEADCAVCRTDGTPIPQLQLTCPPEVSLHYEELCRNEITPPCYAVLPSLSRLVIHSWLSALQVERLEQKTEQVYQRLERCDRRWEDAFFVTLARNFGFGLNSDAFEAWALRLPFRSVDKHRDNLQQVEALFFGQAGLLEQEPPEADDYFRGLRNEFRYLQHKFQLSAPLPAERWRLLRMRPDNFPHVRMAQLAFFYHKEQSLFSRFMEAAGIEEVKSLLQVHTSSYWTDHFTFRKLSPRREKTLGKRAQDLVIINTIVPFLYAYGRYRCEEALCNRAMDFLESLKAEDNFIVRQWDAVGLQVTTASDSQALIQLHRRYCERRDCLRCRFGYEYLRRK